MHECHIYCEDAGDEMCINSVYTCPVCINKLIRPVVIGAALYPVMINREPADLAAHKSYLDPDMFDRYAAMEPTESIPPHLRVYCVKEHFVGERVTANPDGTYHAAISRCDKCEGATCMICKKQLNKTAPLDHGCKAELDADEEIREESFEGLERGKDYQFCPTCKRDIQLAAACHHIVCLCKTHFCYQCGEPAIPQDGHYRLGRCTLYPADPPAPAPVVEVAPVRELGGLRARYTAQLLFGFWDIQLEVSHERMLLELDATLELVGMDEEEAGLTGQFVFQHPIMDERLRLVQEEIAEVEDQGALMERLWVQLPPRIRNNALARAAKVARRGELYHVALNERLRDIDEDIRLLSAYEALVTCLGVQAPRLDLQLARHRVQAEAVPRVRPEVVDDAQRRIEEAAELLEGLRVGDAAIDPDLIGAPAHREDGRGRGREGYATRRDMRRRAIRMARRRRD
jgi:hypothetical protein